MSVKFFTNNLHVLDDMNFLRRHSDAAVVDSELVEPNPEIPDAFHQHVPLLDGGRLSSLNAQVDLGCTAADTVARQFRLDIEVKSAEQADHRRRSGAGIPPHFAWTTL